MSRLRRRQGWSLLYFLSKVGYDIVPVDHYSWINNAPGFMYQYIFVHSVYIISFYDDFWWTVRRYGTHFIFDIICFSLDYSYFYYVYIFILSCSIWYCSFNILFRSSYYCFLTRIIIYDRFIFCSGLISKLKYKYLYKIYHDLSTIIYTYFLIYSLNFIFWSSELLRTFFKIHWLSLFYQQNIKRQSFIFFIHFYMFV